YYNGESDVVFEIGLTPNRIDAAGHYGVARDLAAYFSMNEKTLLKKPDISNFRVDRNECDLKITVENTSACPRYTGLVIKGVTVKESPLWLQNRLKAIGQKPINNIVDITNYILHDVTQPLHAFDLDKIKGNHVKIKNVTDKTPFITLDGTKIELSADDLMICNETEPMCIAGVFGGIESGVTSQTKNIFLESAYFSPSSIRRTARRHQLQTDAAFRFERGIDPNGTVTALKRAALLIKEIAGGEIVSEVFDTAPQEIPHIQILLPLSKVRSMVGKEIDKGIIINILEALEIKVVDCGETLQLEVPPFKVDVTRCEDVVEEILRIYGYNNVEIPDTITYSMVFPENQREISKREALSDYLSNNGFYETMSNSLIDSKLLNHFPEIEKQHVIHLLNPNSKELDVLRPTIIPGLLASLKHNSNRQNPDVKLYEWGNIYKKNINNKGIDAYSETLLLAAVLSGNQQPKRWNATSKEVDFYTGKSYFENSLIKLEINLQSLICKDYVSNNFMGQVYYYGEKEIGRVGLIKNEILDVFDIQKQVAYFELNYHEALLVKNKDIKYTELPKFFENRRDLSLLLDEKITFEQLRTLAFKTEKNYLKDVFVFDVYRGKGIPEGKKSYSLGFILQDIQNTMNDKQIENTMERIIQAYKKEFSAELR
ncbi:MAG: phenylalanine--tRNA ligase subunit beta, partial [Bacteroidales bacterium]